MDIDYQVRAFAGVNQSLEQLLLDPMFSPEAYNVDTSGGGLRVAKGYARWPTVPCPGGITQLMAFHLRVEGIGEPLVLAVNEGGVYSQEVNTWRKIYSGAGAATMDFLNYQIGGQDVIVCADGVRPVIYWTGQGSMQELAGCPKKFSHLALNYERLWGAGAPGEPDEVYWSRAFEAGNWAGDLTNPEGAGGMVSIPTWNGGRVIALKALYQDIVVFKERDIFRVVGTYPGNYTVMRVSGVHGPISERTVVAAGDACYFFSSEGICRYDGVSAHPLTDRMLERFMTRVDFERAARTACASVCKGVLRVALPLKGSQVNNAVVELDIARGLYMLRSGIQVNCFLNWGDKLLFSNDTGYVYEWGVGDTYDGAPIEAVWALPWADAHDRAALKHFSRLSCHLFGKMRVALESERGSRDLVLDGGQAGRTVRMLAPGSGRIFRMVLRNEGGGGFEVDGGITLSMEKDID